jgi:hypothetical protein
MLHFDHLISNLLFWITVGFITPLIYNEKRIPSEKMFLCLYTGADKSLARPGRKQATATEDFEFHISYL